MSKRCAIVKPSIDRSKVHLVDLNSRPVATYRWSSPFNCNIFLIFSIKYHYFWCLLSHYADMLICMSINTSFQSNLDSQSTAPGFSETAAVGSFGLEDFSGCDAGELVKLALQANDVRRRVECYLSAVLVRLGELEGDDAVMSVCKQFDLPAYKTRRHVRIVKGLSALPDVVRAAKDGWLTQDHAELIAASHRRAPMSTEEQLDLLALGVQQDCDEFKNTVLQSETQRLAAEGLNPTEQQHKRRKAKIFAGDDDMVVLHAELDRLAGEKVKTAIDALTTRMFKQDHHNGNKRSFEQRNADALVHLITHTTNNKHHTTNTTPTDETPADATVEPIPQQTTIILTTDYDTLTGQLKSAGLIDGTPISIDEIRRLACEANILPAIFNNQKQPLYLGRSRRTHTKAQLLALHKRDKRCTSCGIRASSCEVHHIMPWEHGGTTNIDNLTLLCPKCHHHTHKHTYPNHHNP